MKEGPDLLVLEKITLGQKEEEEEELFWSSQKKNVETLEKIQRRAPKIITGLETKI